MTKATKTKFLSSAFKNLTVFALCLVTACAISAGPQVPNIQGRWEFAITSGDTSVQLSAIGQSTISTYLLQSGSTLTNILYETTDSIACDVEGSNISVGNSSIDSSGNVVVVFTISQSNQAPFQFVFTGTYAPAHGNSPAVITGTYQRSAGGCTQGSLGTGSPDGTFAATYFADLSGTWDGGFDAPNSGTGPTSVPATFTLTTNPDKTISGTVSAPGLANLSGTACLAGPVTLQPMSDGTVSYVSGVFFELFGVDANGTWLWVNGMATNPDGTIAAVGEDDPADGSNGTMYDGTNLSYTAYYGISGGPCDGLGGGDAPFKLVTPSKPQSKKKGHQKHNRHAAHKRHHQ